jgi:hypothetical protein
MHHRVAGADLGPVGVADDPRAVVVAEHEVVELRQEAHRRRLVGVGQREVRQVEQLPAGLVAVHHEFRPQRLDLVAQLAQPRPDLQVGDRGRPARGEVTPQQRSQGRPVCQRFSDPVLGERAGHVPAPAPHPGRRRVQQRQLVLRRPGQRHGVAVGEALPEALCQHRTRQHLPGEDLARRTGQLGQIEAGDLPGER